VKRTESFEAPTAGFFERHYTAHDIVDVDAIF